MRQMIGLFLVAGLLSFMAMGGVWNAVLDAPPASPGYLGSEISSQDSRTAAADDHSNRKPANASGSGATPSTPVASRVADFARTSPLFTPGTSLPSIPAPVEVRRTAADTEIQQAPVLVRSVESSAFLKTASQAAHTSPSARVAAVRRPETRHELVVALQEELRRASCYAGAIDGDWGPGSRRAMREFLSRVNATLPVHSPDYVQLVLLRSNPSIVCGVSCGQGETRSASGRCVTREVVAANDAATAISSSAVSSNARERGAISGWTTRVEAIAQPAPLVVPAPRLAIRADHAPQPNFEGRMALSGPRPDALPADQSAPGVTTKPALTGSDRGPALQPPPATTRRATNQHKSAKPRRSYARSKAQRQRALFKEAFGDTL